MVVCHSEQTTKRSQFGSSRKETIANERGQFALASFLLYSGFVHVPLREEGAQRSAPFSFVAPNHLLLYSRFIPDGADRFLLCERDALRPRVSFVLIDSESILIYDGVKVTS